MLEFFHNFVREGAAAGDFGEVFGHLAEDVGGSVGEQKDGGWLGLGHAWNIVYSTPSLPLRSPPHFQDNTANSLSPI